MLISFYHSYLFTRFCVVDTILRVSMIVNTFSNRKLPPLVGTPAPFSCRPQFCVTPTCVAGASGQILTLFADFQAVVIFLFRHLFTAIHQMQQTPDVPLVLCRIDFFQKTADAMFFHSPILLPVHGLRPAD